MLRDLLRGKRDEEPSPEEQAAAAAAQRKAELEAKLRQALTENPIFQVTTVDGLKWICPYTGARLPADFGFTEPALSYLLAAQPWSKAKAKSLAEMLRLRWAIWLRDFIRDEPRARIFAEDRWLNPLNAEWVTLPGYAGKVTDAVLDLMAAAMASCPQGRGSELRSRDELERIGRTANHEDSSTLMPVLPTANTRVSGAAPTPRGHSGATTDLDLAGGILGKILSPMPNLAGWRFAAHYEPHAQVGGDLFEVQRLDGDRWFVALADVTGHGVQGAMVVVSALKTLRFVLKQERELVPILARLNEDMKADLLDGQFITCWAGILDTQAAVMECVCAGHHPALLLRHGRSQVLVERVGGRGLALGLARGEAFRRTLQPVRLELHPGDILLQYTDGFTEAQDAKNQEFGELRLAGRLLDHAEEPFPDLLPAIARAARRFAIGTLADDATLLAISPEPPAEG